MGYASIKSGIVDLLETSTKANVVYDYEEPKPSGYPAVMVTNYDSSAEFGDTQRFRRNWGFRILVAQERVNVGPSEAERLTAALVDEIVGLFDNNANYTLGNTVIFFEPPSTKWAYISGPDVDVRSVEILLQGVTLQ